MLRQGTADAVFQSREYFEPVDEPVHPGAKLLAGFWREREAAGGFVVGRDVPSRPLARILHNIALFEPLGGSHDVTDLRVRLAGDTLRRRFGRDTTGARLSELFERHDFEAHIAWTRSALDRGVPLFVRSETRRGAVVERRLENVVLPVWNPYRTARWVLVGMFYFN